MDLAGIRVRCARSDLPAADRGGRRRGVRRALQAAMGAQSGNCLLSSSPTSSRRSAPVRSTPALIVAMTLPSGANSGVATTNASGNVTARVEGESAGPDLGELAEELPMA
jgi:hypothetical protein